ncbi:PWWP domain-containing protein [Phytophthora infestans]|uniref:PWWP domain-containing protein n=1 Tax=Phytophthora infestans TaxID=4787 RepID=A0A833TFG0_PHYIN|nr:PWWP domain-containing protein [Phytophthora infestans]
MVKEMPLDIGLRVDVLDDEGIWNTGVVVDVGKEADEDEDKVEVKYDGWGDEYNQWIDVASQRLAPLHTYTIVKKCWAKLTKWPWWPAFVVLRAPTTALAAHGLEEETKLYVEFYDSFNEEKRSRCWMQKKNVASFRDSFEERASKNIGKNFPKFVEGTQRAKAGTSPLLFSGPGTLPIEYSSKMAEPLDEKRKECTTEQWFHLYRDFSNRYQDLYGYSTAPTGSSSSSSPGLKMGKRAPGRPKKVVKQEQSEDEDDSEEKDEEPEAAESGDEEGQASTSARQATRRNKRAAAPAPSARRITRPRRVKVIEVLTDTSSSMVGSSFSPAPSVRDSSSRSSSIARDTSAATNRALFTALHSVDAALPVNCLYSDDNGMAPIEPCLKDVVDTHRRKHRPANLSARANAAKKPKTEGQAPKRDPDFYQDWSGGSRYEVDNKPWSILGWLTEGLKSRLQRK